MNVVGRIAVPIAGWYRPAVVLLEDSWRSAREGAGRAEDLAVVLEQDHLEKRPEPFVGNAEGPLEFADELPLRRFGPAVRQCAVDHVQQDRQALLLRQDGSGFSQKIVGFMGANILDRPVEQ